MLEGILNADNAACKGILTTPECVYDFTLFEKHQIKIIRCDPKVALIEDSDFLRFVNEHDIDCFFFYGWSWIVPGSFYSKHLSLTLHPGKLPDDRGGSPLQNQIRNGEQWSYANLIELGEKLDGGDIFSRQKFSLEGEMSDVWTRMTSAGILQTRDFLENYSERDRRRQKQTGEGTIYKRVTPAQAEILPTKQTAEQIYNIIRAHNESDANTYVKKAHIKEQGYELVLLKSVLENQGRKVIDLGQTSDATIYGIACEVNEGSALLRIQASDGKPVYISQFLVRAP